MTGQITLYTAEVSPHGHRVELALAEVGVPFTRYEILLWNKPEWYALKVNPTGMVPAIAYGGPNVPADKPSPGSTKIAESLVLVEFIADLFPDRSSLLPKDPVTRAKARFFIEAFRSKFGTAFGALVGKGEEGAEATIFEAIETVQKLKSQEGKRYAVSDDFTIADVAVLPIFVRLEIVLENDLGNYEPGRGNKFMETLRTDDRYKVYREYVALLRERESFKKTFSGEKVLEQYRGMFAKK